MRPSPFACLLAAMLLAAPATRAAVVEVVRLDPSVHPEGGYRPGSASFSPDGDYVCFNADAVTDEALELYCSAMRPPQPGKRVSSALTSGSRAMLLAFLPDGERVLYLAPELTVGVNEIFVAPMDASQPPVRLNAPLPAGHAVTEHSLKPRLVASSQRVVYVVRDATNQLVGIRSVGLAGPASDVALHASLPGPVIIDQFLATADGQHVLFVARGASEGPRELYRVPITGGSAVKLSGLMAGGGISSTVQLSPDGAHAVYIANALDPDTIELFSVPVAGGPVHRLNVPGLQVSSFWLVVLADGSGVVHLHIRPVPNTTEEVADIYRAPIRGEQASELIEADVPFPYFASSPDFRLVPALPSQRLLVSSPSAGEGSDASLWSKHLDGSGQAIQLAPPDASPEIDYFESIDRVFTRDGDELLVVSPDGSSVVPLTASVNGRVRFHRWVPGSQRILALRNVNQRNDALVLSPTGDPPPLVLNSQRSGSTGLCGLLEAPSGGAHAVYCDGSTQSLAAGMLHVLRLMRRPIGGGAALQLDSIDYFAQDDPVQFADFRDHATQPDTTVYAVVPFAWGRSELRAARIAVDVFGDGFE